jgi:hypothetical protein
MKRLSFLLLDANVIIYLFELGMWDRIVAECDLHISRTVKAEAAFFFRGDQRFEIDLQPYEDDGRIRVFDVPIVDVQAFCKAFDASYVEKLDPGETESLVFALNAKETYLLCSADQIVYKVLGALDRAEQGVSLEEVLQKLGLTRALKRQFQKAFRDAVAGQGFVDSLQGRGVKPKKP